MAINPFTGGSIALADVPVELQPQFQQSNRQQQMANLLLQQGMSGQPQGQMVSGHYVKPSWAQQLAPMANQALAMYAGYQADKGQTELAAALRGRQEQDIVKFGELLKTDPSAAYTFASKSYVPQLREAGLKKMMPQEFDLVEGAKRFMSLPDNTVKEIASGGKKPRSPVSVGNYLVDPESGQVIFQAPEKPTAGQVVERDDGTFLVNTRTGQATPVLGTSGQPLMGAGKPLTESQGKASAFQSQMVSANNAVNTLESQGFDPTSFKSQTAVKLAGGVANIAIPVAAQQYKQAQDQWSEAYLRFKTGAAATEPEVVRNNRTFFPVFGDKPEQIAQKAAAREQAERDIGIAAGRGSNLGAKAIGQQPKQEKQNPVGLPNQSAIDAELKRRGL
jgi:hypothetical protein